MKLVPYVLLPCPILEVSLAGRGAAKSSGCPSQEAGRTNLVKLFYFSPKLSEGKKKHRHVDHIFWTRAWRVQETPSEALMDPQPVLVHGNHWSLHQPFDLQSTLTRDALSPHREATLNIPSPSPPPLLLSPSFLLWLRVWRHWFWDQLSLLSWFPLLYPYRIPLPKTKKVTKVKSGSLASLPPPLRLQSAGRWCPVPPEGWWLRSSPTPQSAAPEVRQLGAPGLYEPTQGVTEGSLGLPPMASPLYPAVCPVEIKTTATLKLVSPISNEQFMI